ncbi:MAG: alcohol dehydrogenase catalytic domain-containing protein [Firmicutes bacterium]|nr:alcohol dehydrogenase catalytic domain-containing protein [Bacillota bacterium]
MKALVLKRPGVLEVEEVEPFKPRDNQVTVKVDACGICGSDLRYMAGENPWALHTLGRQLPNPPNIILGHEYCGEVVEVVRPEDGDLLGQRVAVCSFRTCGRCPACKNGHINVCKNTVHMGHGAGWGTMDLYPGAMAQYALGWADTVFPLPPEISSEEAALLDPLVAGLHAAKLPRMTPGGTAVIFGGGPIGSAIMQSVRALGAGRVIVTDIYSKAKELAGELGAWAVLDGRSEGLVGEVMSVTGGHGAEAVFDTVGTPGSFDQGLHMLAETGTLVIMAVHAGQISFDGLRLSAERKITTSSNAMLEDYQQALDLMASGALKVRPWITHTFSLDEAPKAFEILREKEKHNAFKALVLPG